MSIRQFNNYLSSKSTEQLVKELGDLYKTLPAVRDYYAMRMGGINKQEVVASFKAVIDQEFFPKRGDPKARLSVARKAVMDLKKLDGVSSDLVDVAIFYVEVGVLFTNSYGDINESFYNSMESMYANALKWASQIEVLQAYQNRFKRIVKSTCNFGWGFHEGLYLSYSNYFDPSEAL